MVRDLLVELVRGIDGDSIKADVTGSVVTRALDLDADSRAQMAFGLVQVVNEITRTKNAGPMVVLQLCTLARGLLGDEAAPLAELAQLSAEARAAVGMAESNIPVSARGGTGPTLMSVRLQKK